MNLINLLKKIFKNIRRNKYYNTNNKKLKYKLTCNYFTSYYNKMQIKYYLAIHTDREYPFIFFTNKQLRDEYIEVNDCYHPYVDDDDMSITTEQTIIDLKVICGQDGFYGVEIDNNNINYNNDDDDVLITIYRYSNCRIIIQQ